MFFLFFSFLYVIGIKKKKKLLCRKTHHKNQMKTKKKKKWQKLINNHRLVIIIQHRSTICATFSIIIFRSLPGETKKTNKTSRKILLIFSPTPIPKNTKNNIIFVSEQTLQPPPSKSYHHVRPSNLFSRWSWISEKLIRSKTFCWYVK